MAREIERKFTVDTAKWQPNGTGVWVRQGYIPASGRTSVRVRIAGDQSFLTIKGETTGMVRTEFEYPIPPADAHQILDELCARPFIEKTRYYVEYAGATWEVDVFEGENAGLVVAEIELTHEDAVFEMPPWVLSEVTDDPKYYNVNLVTRPFCKW
jgi:adenylate cyclase